MRLYLQERYGTKEQHSSGYPVGGMRRLSVRDERPLPVAYRSLGLVAAPVWRVLVPGMVTGLHWPLRVGPFQVRPRTLPEAPFPEFDPFRRFHLSQLAISVPRFHPFFSRLLPLLFSGSFCVFCCFAFFLSSVSSASSQPTQSPFRVRRMAATPPPGVIACAC